MRSTLCVVFACILAFLVTPAAAQQSNPYVSVSIDTPSAGATFQAPATVKVQVSAFTIDDGVYVSQLQILRSAQVLASGSGESLSYTFNSLPAGSYTVTASAKSNLGGKASANVTFNVVQPGERPPVVSLSSATGQPFIGPATVYLSANASDPDGHVVRVDYYANGSQIGSSSVAGFGFAWNNAPPGSHQVTGVAVDNNGKTATSGAISVVVEQSVIRGNLDGINEDGNGVHHLTGWACSSGRVGAVNVHIYVGGPAGTGQFIGEILANQASESAIGAICQSSGSQYRFRFALTNAIRQAHANKLIYMHGISPAGASNSLLAGSGVQRIPAPLRASRRYVYDAQQRLCKTIEPESGSTVMSYDGAGNLVWSASGLALPDTNNCDRAAAEASGRVVRRTYDALSRLKTIAFPDSNGNQTWTYTPDGLPSSVTTVNTEGASQVVNSYAYNKRRILIQETQNQPGELVSTFSYGYSVNGHLSSISYPSGTVIDYAPNALGQASKAGIYVAGASYFPNGGIKQFNYGNAITHNLTQNARGLPLQSCDSYGACGGAAVLNDTYTYDANGNVSKITDGRVGGRATRTMTYDELDRLKTTTSAMFGNAAYAYDALDNLTRMTVGATSNQAARDHYYCYGANWQLTNVKTGGCTGASVIGLSYDVQGNLVNRNGITHTFDYGNRLRLVAYGGSWIEAYRYDAYGRRVRSNGGGLLRSVYSNAGELLYQRNERTSKATDYVMFNGDLVAAIERPLAGGTGTVTYKHTDALGSPVAVTDASRMIAETSEYEPFGRVGNRAARDGVGYTAHAEDAATGLTYMQQRYYDPQIGRFLSVDPVTAYGNPVGAFNRYWYGNNNPYRFTDPDGRYSCTRDGGQCKVTDAKLAESFVAAAGGAHEKMREGSAKALLGGILNMIGSLNDGNGFVIDFSSLPKDTLGQMSSNGMTLDSRQIRNSARGLGVSARAMGGFVVAHEGSHKWDSMQPGARRSYFPATGLERMITEINAYGLESAMGNALGINNQLNVPGMSLKDRRKAVWEGAQSSWEGACTKGGPSCSGYEP